MKKLLVLVLLLGCSSPPPKVQLQPQPRHAVPVEPAKYEIKLPPPSPGFREAELWMMQRRLNANRQCTGRKTLPLVRSPSCCRSRR